MCAATEVFIQNGIEKTKISDIVKVTGIAQGTFYFYFPSKFAVMPSIAETMVNTIFVSLKIAVDLNASIDEQIKKFIQTVLQIYDDNRKHLALIYAGLARNSLHTDRAARLVI